MVEKIKNKEEDEMLKRFIGALAAMAVLASVPAMALDKLVESVEKGCKKEIETYCKDVTPGQGRMLACFYAHSDKLSSQCEYALYDASAQLERFVAALTYIANECRDDLKEYCSGVRQGQGRLLKCLLENRKKLSSRCDTALTNVNAKIVEK